MLTNSRCETFVDMCYFYFSSTGQEKDKTIHNLHVIHLIFDRYVI